MNPRLRTIGAAGLLAVLAFAVYAIPVGTRPLSLDEVAVLRQSQAVVHDAGRLRLFFQVSDDRWLPPIAVYATAAASVVAPPEHAGRLAAAAGRSRGALTLSTGWPQGVRELEHAGDSRIALLGLLRPVMAVPRRTGHVRLRVARRRPVPFGHCSLTGRGNFVAAAGRPAALTLLLLASLAVAPLAASTFGEPYAIASALMVTPLVVILAAGGLASWLAKEHRGWRIAGWLVVATLALDFARFYACHWPG